MFSVTSDSAAGRNGGPQTAQVSTTTLLNGVHNIYLASQPHQLDSSTSVVVNTWLTAAQGGPTVDAALSTRAWEHARRRAEDGLIILGSLHASTPSVLSPFIATSPFAIPSTVYKALDAIQPFLRCVTPYNPAYARQVALSASFTLNLAGSLNGATIALSSGGIDTANGLLAVAADAGYRAFDVFYYLLTSASTPAEREYLGLKAPSEYALLAKSKTYTPPTYLPTADDAASADDFRQALKDIGIKGSSHRNLISVLAGLLKLGNTLDYEVEPEALEDTCEEVAGLLGMEPDVLLNQCSTDDRKILVEGLYESLVDWVISKANVAIEAQMSRIRSGQESLQGRPADSDDNGDTVSITVIEAPDPALGKALCMQSVFDDSKGINAEMIQDGVEVTPAGSSITKEMEQAVADMAADLGISTGPKGRERQHELEKREVVLEKVGYSAEESGFLKKLLFPVQGEGINLGRAGRVDLSHLMSSSRVWYHLSLHPTDDSPASLAALPSITSAWSAGTVSRQLRAWRLPEWTNRRSRKLDYTADFDLDEFVTRYAPLGCKDGKDGVENWMLERGWSNGEIFVGKDRVWIRENAWWEAESMLDVKQGDATPGLNVNPFSNGFDTGYSTNNSGFFAAPGMENSMNNSRDDLVMAHSRNPSNGNLSQLGAAGMAASIAPTAMKAVPKGDYGLGTRGDAYKGETYEGVDDFDAVMDSEQAGKKKIETKHVGAGRRIWVAFVWALTFWIPSPLLRYIGRMRRPDVRMAWREKIVLVFLIFLINAFIIFWIIVFGNLLCPNFDKAWNPKELASHQGTNDYWVGVHGKVYDLTNFWKIQHSDIPSQVITQDNMLPAAGKILDQWFMPPLDVYCNGLGIASTISLAINNTIYPDLVGNMFNHVSGSQQTSSSSKLASSDWYSATFMKKMQEFYHGDLVYSVNDIRNQGKDNSRPWVTYGDEVYDLSQYFQNLEPVAMPQAEFLNQTITDLFKNNPGQDITSSLKAAFSTATNAEENANLQNTWLCIKTIAYAGKTDFRETPKCTVNNWIMLAFTIIICTVILVKFLAALQFSSKRRPAPQDKFVICQVPAYTEGEDSLRKALDSLTALQYDNKRKLIFVICDGVITGKGNDRPTPKIVLDILGVDPKMDPPALPFKSVGAGSEQLNFGKVYSGLYEYEGNVVPYVVVVKVGKETEQAGAKPGNRGKRDSQILLMSFLNRVHHRSPMNPLELEIFHQVNNIIGVDPELYEYLLMVDADTAVSEDSLNRLVSACAHNAKIAGICGETSLQNDEKTWWTMIQVYEYFISHHLAKAFESLFGSVTCLPGCFTMYRLRTVDKGKPLLISDAVIKEYGVCDVDTLHQKNLLSLGEDRYLTTLMTKHFPQMSYKFVPDAQCKTAAPESFGVLISQRRRWINSTIHNLVELMRLEEMCGFCCFGMRFVVLIDLCGTLILPATCAYLGYLIYRLASHTGPFPVISIALLGAVYGLQALVFILKRQWQHIGWMIIYMIAFPIYSFVLPIYSFWNQDNFSWGNTRVVIGEKGSKQVIAVDSEVFDPRSVPLQRWDDYAYANNLPGRRGGYQEKQDGSYGDQYEMDEMRSVYSGMPQGSVMGGNQSFIQPPMPAQFGANNRNSVMSGAHQNPGMGSRRQSAVDLQSQAGYQDFPRPGLNQRSQSNLSGVMGANRSSSAMGYAGGHRPPVGMDVSQSVPNFDFRNGSTAASDAAIIDSIQSVLREVDLDTVTKKQVRALVEQRMQMELVGERRTFLDRQIDRELENM